jgi:antirestriction protein ArdC
VQRHDAYEAITDRVIAAIEEGAGQWQMPWHRSGVSRPLNVHTKKPYRGVNVVALWAAADAYGYSSGFWATYKQWRALDAQVRKGERASLIVFWKELEREVEDKETGERESKKTLFARASWVFNADQVDGWKPPLAPERNPVEALDHAEVFTVATGADMRHGGDRAYYRRSDDHVQMPDRVLFTGSATSTPTETYYATLLHELTHWTGHASRLDRDLSGRFGNEAYAMEELVAELGAAFLCADLSITNTPRPDHAAYIANWLEVLKRDKRAIFTAARKAAQASDYLEHFQQKVSVDRHAMLMGWTAPLPASKCHNAALGPRDRGSRPPHQCCKPFDTDASSVSSLTDSTFMRGSARGAGHAEWARAVLASSLQTLNSTTNWFQLVH